MKKKWLGIAVVVALALVVISVVWWENRGVYVGKNIKTTEEPKVAPNDWTPYLFIADNDSCNVYKVTWSQKYGLEKIAFCKAIFRNDKEKQYRLIAPWLPGGFDIERANMDDLKAEKIPFDSVPAGAIKK